jgi:pimeloyl-ACP methyl ester carboxylesterase
MSNPYPGPMQPWPALAPYSREVTLAGGLRLHLYDAGDVNAPATLLIHGLGDEADTWRHVVEPLAARGRVIAPDLPGFGRSDKPRRRYTIPFFCETLLALLDALSLQRVTLVGNSLGGILAHAIARARPERVERLVLVDGGLAARPQKIQLSMMLMLLPLVGEWSYNRLRRDPREAYETLRAYYADMDRLPDADRQFLFQRVNERVWDDRQRDAYLSVLRQMPGWMMSQSAGLGARVEQSSVPLQVVWGECDRIIPLDNAHALVAAQPGATLALIPGAGHLPHQEQPRAFLDRLITP